MGFCGASLLAIQIVAIYSLALRDREDVPGNRLAAVVWILARQI